MRRWQKINRISWKPLAAFAILVLLSGLWLRAPGFDVGDGRNDRGRNGIVLGASWTAGEAAKPALAIGELARALREHHITELYLHFPPPNADGALPALDAARIEALLYECYDARGWAQIGGVRFPLNDVRWRRFFILDLRRLLDRHPRLRGVSLDFAGSVTESPALLAFLDELRAALAPDTRPLSIVAGSWKEAFFREVARRADHLVVPLDVAKSSFSRFNFYDNAERIGKAQSFCEGKPVLIRIPADQRLRRGLATLHYGLGKWPASDQYQGIVLDAGDGPSAAGWLDFRARFVKP